MSEEVFVKRILVLANSRKFNGRCVAGVTVEDGGSGLWRPATNREWVRPVNAESDVGELTRKDRLYQGCREPELLDVVEVGLNGRFQKGYQTENWLIDRDYQWVKRGEVAVDGLSGVEDSTSLWLGRSSRRRRRTSKKYHDKNDRIYVDNIDSIEDSLRLIRVRNLRYRVYTHSGESYASERRRVRAVFSHRRKEFEITVTDPSVEQEYSKRADGTYTIGPAYITVSLSEPYENFVYRLAAAIIKI